MMTDEVSGVWTSRILALCMARVGYVYFKKEKLWRLPPDFINDVALPEALTLEWFLTSTPEARESVGEAMLLKL